MSEAQKIIDGPPVGFRVAFEHLRGGMLHGDTFPERDEPLIPTEEEAWALARAFASRTKGKCVNIYVIDSYHTPVPNYRSKMIENR